MNDGRTREAGAWWRRPAVLIVGVVCAVVVGLAGVGFVMSRQLPTWLSAQREDNIADAALLHSLELPDFGAALAVQSDEGGEPRCTLADCPSAGRSAFLVCFSCAAEAERAVRSAVRELEAQGWVLLGASDDFWELELPTEESSTGMLWMQVSLRTGEGFIDPAATLPADGTETEVRVRIATEAYG